MLAVHGTGASNVYASLRPCFHYPINTCAHNSSRNRYPGAMSDTEAYIYRYSWDKDDLLSYPWPDHYVKQPEVLAYLTHVVRKYDLRQFMQFNTEMTGATWDDDAQRWVVETRREGGEKEVYRVRFVVAALGLLSRTNLPDIPGLERFKGEKHHTAKWPSGLDLTGKRVGVIGNGSTGVQVITAVAPIVKNLVCFQRHPQYSVPSGDGPVSEEYRKWVNENYDEIFDQVRNSITAFGFKESEKSCIAASPEERRRVFEENWNKGNGFRFMFGTFNDITVDPAANEEACEFIRGKIRSIVKDPEKARRLCPQDYYARRPLCDGGYYSRFNQENVEIVRTDENPISEVTETGVRMVDGQEFELDVLVFATGFDAVEGNYMRLNIRGRGGRTLQEQWEGGPTSYLGVSTANFPNWFMIAGPQGPFTNLPPAIEAQVTFIARLIERALQSGDRAVVEATEKAETDWVALCNKLCAQSLFKVTDSWIFGVNVPKKKRAVRFYFGGMQKYLECMQGKLKYARNRRGCRADFVNRCNRS
jgi:cyclohexanone monooxygenase